MLLMQAQENGVVLVEEQLFFIAGGQANTFDDDVDEPPVQDLALNVDQVFQADQCDAFDYDIDDTPTTQTMFIANLSSADPIYDDASPSYYSNILSEVQDHDNYLDIVGEYHEDNAKQVVQSNVSTVPNDALIMIINYMHEHATQCISANEQNKVVNASLTAKLVRYKEQVNIYEKKARYGYIKNHKKTAKNGQTRTRETEEHKRSQRCKAKARKSQKVKDVVNLQSTLVNKSHP
ncbi:hypothetical protein Tco_0179611 [Tanacetum coccineum]